MSGAAHPTVDTGAAATLPAREDLDVRLRADESSRVPAMFCFITGLAWLLVGSVLGEIASIKMHLPDLWTNVGALTFGRLRPAHLNTMIYGWASLAMIGVSLWLLPRLVHTALRLPWLALLGSALWNLGMVIGFVSILAGYHDGIEWLEMPRYIADPFFVIGGGMIGVSLLATLAAREVKHLYVSVWYVMASYVWFPIIFLIGNWPTFTGVESAAANWFYAHNALGLWLTAICLGAIYYFIPKVLGRPIYSYQLSLLGFWTLAFFYSLNGMHHLVGGPLPTWMITTSIVASALMIIPVLAVAVNHHMTMVGRFRALRYSPTLRFIVFGAVSYTAVSLQGMFTALREVNRITHFTHWTIAHAHVGVYGFVTFVLFGSMYYIFPRVLRREWPSASLIHWHFWLVAIGLGMYVIPLTVFGVLQGLALLDPATPFSESVARSLPGLWARSVAGIVLSTGHIVFVYHCWWMIRGARAERRIPQFHEARPVLFDQPDAQPAPVAASRQASV